MDYSVRVAIALLGVDSILGRADVLEGTFASAFLIDWLAARWSAEGIKLFAGVSWFLLTLWFVLGLFEPVARIWW